MKVRESRIILKTADYLVKLVGLFMKTAYAFILAAVTGSVGVIVARFTQRRAVIG